MKHTFPLSLALLTSLSFGACQTTTAAVVDPENIDTRFEALLALEGDWVAQDVDEEGAPTRTPVRWRATSGGTAIEEILNEGSEHEMVTMIHRDLGELSLTHYCTLGNQPRMVAVSAPGEIPIRFECVGGQGMASEDDAHMHAVSYDILDESHVIATWTLHEAGEMAHERAFDFVRVR